MRAVVLWRGYILPLFESSELISSLNQKGLMRGRSLEGQKCKFIYGMIWRCMHLEIGVFGLHFGYLYLLNEWKSAQSLKVRTVLLQK